MVWEKAVIWLITSSIAFEAEGVVPCFKYMNIRGGLAQLLELAQQRQ